MSEYDTKTVGTAGFAWGYNNKGGLGAAGSLRVLRPIPVTLPAGTIDVQGGSDFSVALTSAGQVFTWGGNQWGQLGDGSTRHRFGPHQVTLTGNPHIVTIAVGNDHVVAVSRHGRVFAWGRNDRGQVGDGTRQDRSTPVAVTVPGPGTVTQVAAGDACSFALLSSGVVQAWGFATPLGAAAPPVSLQAAASGVHNVLTPHQLELPTTQDPPAAVAAGQRHLVVLTTEGKLLTYGLTAAGRVASGSLPVDAAWGKITSISAGDNHTVALTDEGAVLAWGANHFGQLGDRTTTSHDTPVKVRIHKQHGRVVQVIAGGDSTLARTDGNRVYSWGHGGFGQHGDSSIGHRPRPEPVRLPDQAQVTDLFTGRYHCFATTGH